jgi:hypothetical protein
MTGAPGAMGPAGDPGLFIQGPPGRPMIQQKSVRDQQLMCTRTTWTDGPIWTSWPIR